MKTASFTFLEKKYSITNNKKAKLLVFRINYVLYLLFFIFFFLENSIFFSLLENTEDSFTSSRNNSWRHMVGGEAGSAVTGLAVDFHGANAIQTGL